MGVERRLLAVAALAVLAGCAEVAPFQPQAPSNRLGVWVPDPSATILRTDQSGFANPTLVVVSDSPTWGALWTQAWGGVHASPALPSLDFVLSSVIVVAVGRRLGLGYSVGIDSLVVTTVGAVLYATEEQPGARCNTSTGVSAPAHLVHYPGHPPIIEWRVGAVKRDCSSLAPAP